MRLRNSMSPPVLGNGISGDTPEERRALDRLFSLTCEELRRLASSVKRDDSGSTLNPTELVNETWLKMGRSPGMLVESARRRNAHKRGESGEAIFVSFDDSQDGLFENPVRCGEDLLALDSALEDLARLEPRQAAIKKSRTSRTRVGIAIVNPL